MIYFHIKRISSKKQIYKILLKLGNSTTGPIMGELGISSSRTYASLNNLIKKGLFAITMPAKAVTFNNAKIVFFIAFGFYSWINREKVKPLILFTYYNKTV